MRLPVLNVLRTSRLPILHQLYLEEALLRGGKENWLLINDGAFYPAIVMGISGRPAELVHEEDARQAGVQLIKRFTGGGTVVVDQDTLFATLIMNGDSLPGVDCYPQPIMKWTEAFYSSVFAPVSSNFRLRENDYVFGEHKFGGNAQAITGRRWLHHTSFLWDYDAARMRMLKHPPKAPQYRQGRHHGLFVTRLRDHMPHRAQLLASIADAAHALDGFTVQERTLSDASAALAQHTLLGTKVVPLGGRQA